MCLSFLLFRMFLCLGQEVSESFEFEAVGGLWRGCRSIPKISWISPPHAPDPPLVQAPAGVGVWWDPLLALPFFYKKKKVEFFFFFLL